MYDIRDVAIPRETVWNRSSKDKTGKGQQHDDNEGSFWSIIMARKIVRKEGVTMGLSFALGVASKSLATVRSYFVVPMFEFSIIFFTHDVRLTHCYRREVLIDIEWVAGITVRASPISKT
jgi:hypothetical protein